VREEQMKYDDKGMKWLHVRNWKKYQPDGKLFRKDARLKYVLDWTDKLDNYDYQQLTMFQRALFEHVCLVAGTRPLRSMPNDPTWLSSTLHVPTTERPRIPHALSTLLEHGYLFTTNDEKFSEEEEEAATEKPKKGSGELRVESRDRDGELRVEQETVLVNSEATSTPKKPNGGFEAEDGEPDAPVNWKQPAKPKLQGFDVEEA
jgi:hypothetical protein